MINRLFLSLALIFNCLFISCKGQQLSEKNYIDFVIKGHRLFALTSKGHINIFDTNTSVSIDTNIHADTAITAITIDKKENIVVLKANNKIDVFDDEKLQFRPLLTSKNPVYNVIFDQSNNAYLITDKGINDVSTRKNYCPDTSFRLNKQLMGWIKPSAVFIDKNDNIWLGSGRGEWGGELFVFDTKTKKFIKPVLNSFEIDLYPVKSIFGDGESVYISCGLQHFSTSGCIIKFNNFNCSSVFSSESHWEKEGADIKKMIDGKSTGPAITERMVNGEYIGPATYKDNSLYFYSQNGLFKGDKDKELSKISNWTKIASPQLHWINGQPDAVGSPMNVLKMMFAENGRLFLVTQNDGIGVFDGKTFQLLN